MWIIYLIITKGISKIISIASKYNIAAKPCGAGGGDMVLCFGDKNKLKLLSNELRKNFLVIALSPENKGVYNLS